MAEYHLEAKVISRGNGRSAVAAAAYMSCSRMYNDYDGIQHDYTRKYGLIYQEVMLPSQAPSEWADRERLWNAVEENEKTKDSRLARELVIALPIELDTAAQVKLLREFIKKDFVDLGMCADFAVHDTDGHNPHAHIMLTVRPLNENGTWQYKSEKEYLCIRNGEEKGFTAAEFKTAQKDGWEKQYQYKAGKKKMYMSPSEAQTLGYERVSKYPKSSRYGRQNPIAARWNSDQQLNIWRADWAEVINQALKEHGIDSRVDHRSFADRGITEQPTIHEGYIARKIEKNGFTSKRCEINRQIRADNKLLRELKRQMDKLSETIRGGVTAIAGLLENIREHMILLQYYLFHNRAQAEPLAKWVKDATPVITEYKLTEKQIKAKQTERRTLTARKKDTGIFNPIRNYQLSQQITTITEEIEELKSHSEQLMFEISCRDKTEIKQADSDLAQMTVTLDKLDKQHERLNGQIENEAKQFIDVKSKVAPEQASDLLDARLLFRETSGKRIMSKLREVFGQKISTEQFHTASDQVDRRLGEDSEMFRERLLQKRWEREQERVNHQSVRQKEKSWDYER